MDWATRSLIVLLLGGGIGYLWYRHDQYYKTRGLVHPITAWITKNMYIEVQDRKRRIEAMEYHHGRAEERAISDPRNWAKFKEYFNK